MAKPTITISLTPAQFAEKEAELNKDGITIKDDKGEIKKSGVDLQYVYDGVSTLTITVQDKPFFIGESNLEAKIRFWFATPIVVTHAPADKASPKAFKVGDKVSFHDSTGNHAGTVVTVDSDGGVVIGSLTPPIAGNLTVTKTVADLTAA